METYSPTNEAIDYKGGKQKAVKKERGNSVGSLSNNR